MAEIKLTPEQNLKTQRLAEIIGQKTKEDVLRMTRLLVTKKDHEVLGATEFDSRSGSQDRCVRH